VAKVIGLGGIFFKSANPAKLAKWYSRHLGIDLESELSANFKPGDMPTSGCTVWSPFPAATRYFAPSTRQFMINFVVDDLEGALKQVVRGGARVVGDIQEYPYGRFGWFLDPERNKIELWQVPHARKARRPTKARSAGRRTRR
jgi:predicted enzyme related to lactoylglutathione lyase